MAAPIGGSKRTLLQRPAYLPMVAERVGHAADAPPVGVGDRRHDPTGDMRGLARLVSEVIAATQK